MKNKTARLFNDISKWHCFIIKAFFSESKPLPSLPKAIKKFITFIYCVSIFIYYVIIQTVCNICDSFSFILF